MKYIRTEAAVYEVLRKSETKKSYITAKSGFVIHKDNVIKQADNIEELYDELVEYGNRPIVITQANVKRGRMCGKTRIIYGAIWTDKGLIYVAKMKGILPNGEIDWELL